MVVKHLLRWGGLFRDKTVRDVEFKVAESGAILLMDNNRRAGISFLVQLLVSCTTKIGGAEPTRTECEAFWRSVKWQDSQLAIIQFVQPNWGDETQDQDVVCSNGHVTQHPVSLTQFEILPEIEPTFSVEWKPGWEFEPGKVAHVINGETGTMKMQESLQEYIMGERVAEMNLRSVAMCCSLPEYPEVKLSLGHVMRMPPALRKTLNRELNEKRRIIDLSFRTRCSTCGMPVEGQLNIVDFL